MQTVIKKYLIDPDYIRSLPVTFTQIEQTYLSLDPEVMIRCSNGVCSLIVKSNGNLSETDSKIEIPMECYQAMRLLSKSRILIKQRTLIKLPHGIIAEVEYYHDELDGLATAKVEFSSLEDANAFVPPKWFLQDVTYDKAFKSKHLAAGDLMHVQEVCLKLHHHE